MEFNFIKFDWSGLPSGKLNGVIDPTYAKIIKKLEENYNGCIVWDDVLKTRKDKRNLLRHFAQHYMMPWEFWVNLFRNHGINSSSQKGYMVLSFAPYCYVYRPPYYVRDGIDEAYVKLRHILRHISWEINKFKDANKTAILVKNVEILIENLRFPHCNLDEFWRLYEKNICTEPSKIMFQTYQKMKNLHKKLELLQGVDDDLWFTTLLEVEEYDVEFIEQRTEYQIGRDLSNQKLWKLYLNFLKRRNNIEKLLQTYSKYCRFYLDDVEMKEEYRELALQNGGPFEVPWKNPFDFEIYNENAKEQWKQPANKNTVADQKQVEKCEAHFSPEGISNQNFDFRHSFIHYIIQNSPASLKQKLQKTCKYFFAKFPIPVIYKFVVDENSLQEEISQDSIQVSNLEKLKHNIHISTIFIFKMNSSNNCLSNFIPNIYFCDAKYIEISNQDFTINELKHLIGHGNVTELTLEKCVVTYDVETRVPLENILELTPKLEYFEMRFPKITTETSQNLLNLKFQSKFRHIKLYNLTPDLEPFIFMEFFNNNTSPDCEIRLFDRENLKAGNLFKVVSEELRKKWGYRDAPRFSCNTLSADFDTLH